AKDERGHERNVSDLIGPGLRECSLGFGFGFCVGILEFMIDLFSYFGGPRRILYSNGVPTHLSFGITVYPCLVEIVVAKEKGHRLGGLLIRVINDYDINLPGLVAPSLAPNGGENRNFLTELPMKPLGGFPSDNGAGPGLQPRLFLFRG